MYNSLSHTLRSSWTLLALDIPFPVFLWLNNPFALTQSWFRCVNTICKNILSILKITLHLQDDFLYLCLYSLSVNYITEHSRYTHILSFLGIMHCISHVLDTLVPFKSLAYLKQVTDGRTPNKLSHLQFSQWIITYHNNIHYNNHFMLFLCYKTLLLGWGFALNKRRLALKNWSHQ